jgi:hypothetical protein
MLLQKFPVKIILERNVFYFDGKFYRQKRGTAMGTKMAPTYATLVLGYLEHILYNYSEINQKGPPVRKT